MALTPPSTPPSPYSINSLSDIFSDSPPNSPSHADPSDIPRLRATHSTAGYRAGISASKTEFLQPGFDEGYSLGATFGIRVGYLLGVLEGLCASLDQATAAIRHMGKSEQDTKAGKEQRMVEELLMKARKGLVLEKIFSKEFWGEDGIWRYQVKGKEDDVTFREVVDSHPTIQAWSRIVEEEIREKGIRKSPFEGLEWEAGRIEDQGKTPREVLLSPVRRRRHFKKPWRCEVSYRRIAQHPPYRLQQFTLSSSSTPSSSHPFKLPRYTHNPIDEPHETYDTDSTTSQRQQRRQALSPHSQSRPSSSSRSSRTLRRTPRLEPRIDSKLRLSSAPAPRPLSLNQQPAPPVTPASFLSDEIEGQSTPRRIASYPRNSSYWPRRTTRISRHTAEAILYALEAIRGDPEGRLGSPGTTPLAPQPQQWKPRPFTPHLAEVNASMSDLVGGTVSNGRTQNGGLRGGPIAQAGGDRVQTPTQIMTQRRAREARRKEENERQLREQDEARKGIIQEEEETEQDSRSAAAAAAAGVGLGSDRLSYRRSKDRTSAGEPLLQPTIEQRPGAKGSMGNSKANLPTQPTVYAPSNGRTQRLSAVSPEIATGRTSIIQPRTRQRGATLSTGQPRPVDSKPTQTPRAVSAAPAAAGGSMDNQASQTRQGSKAAPISLQRPDRPATVPTSQPQGGQESTSGSHQRSNTSSFPHAFERWEQLSSHWEGLTSFWIRRLEQNKEDLDREPLNQQMARQVTDLSAAGANLFHAVVELQRLRASSERKFQRWFFETRAEQERSRENQARLEEQLRTERSARTETATSSARSDNEIKAAYAAKATADVQVKEMRRELTISKDEARRAWEELGRREQEERDRTTSLKRGEPTLVGGVQVVPMAQGSSRQESTVRPSTRDGPASIAAPHSQGPIGSPTGDEPGYTIYDPARSETDTDPFTEGGSANPARGYREQALPPSQSHQQTSNSSSAAVQAGQVDAYTSSQPSNSQTTRTTTTTTTGGGTYLRYRPDDAVSTLPQPSSSFYQHGGTSLQNEERQPRVSEGDERSYVPSIEDTVSEEDYDLDSNGEVRRDAAGNPVRTGRPIGSEDSDEYDIQEALERERMHGRSYGSAIPGVEYGSGPTTGEGRGRSSNVDYSGSDYGPGYEFMPRHHHPTRLSDVLEEDERSRTSPSRASQNSRGIR